MLVDGEVIASRTKGLLKRLVGGGWPNEDEVVAAIRERMAAATA